MVYSDDYLYSKHNWSEYIFYNSINVEGLVMGGLEREGQGKIKSIYQQNAYLFSVG